MNVFIVDDSIIYQELLAEILANAGYTAISAKNGFQALDMLSRFESPPSVILLDLLMPVMNGWEFCAALAEDRRFCAIPVIVLSVAPMLPDMIRGLRVLAALPKPVDIEQLLAVIARLDYERAP